MLSWPVETRCFERSQWNSVVDVSCGKGENDIHGEAGDWLPKWKNPMIEITTQ